MIDVVNGLDLSYDDFKELLPDDGVAYYDRREDDRIDYRQFAKLFLAKYLHGGEEGETTDEAERVVAEIAEAEIADAENAEAENAVTETADTEDADTEVVEEVNDNIEKTSLEVCNGSFYYSKTEVRMRF